MRYIRNISNALEYLQALVQPGDVVGERVSLGACGSQRLQGERNESLVASCARHDQALVRVAQRLIQAHLLERALCAIDQSLRDASQVIVLAPQAQRFLVILLSLLETVGMVREHAERIQQTWT